MDVFCVPHFSFSNGKKLIDLIWTPGELINEVEQIRATNVQKCVYQAPGAALGQSAGKRCEDQGLPAFGRSTG